MKCLAELQGKRLNTIREFTELQGGFKVAMRDLEIRETTIFWDLPSVISPAIGFCSSTAPWQEAVQRLMAEAPASFQKAHPEYPLPIVSSGCVPGFKYIDDEEQKMEFTEVRRPWK